MPATLDRREACLQVAHTLLLNKKRCIWTESSERWEWHAFKTPHFPFEGDCWSACTAICYWADGNDPNGVNFAYGDTATGLAHAYNKNLIIPKKELLAGDFIMFGPHAIGEKPVHGVMSLQNAKQHSNPLCFSHGRPGDPSVVPLSVLLGLGPAVYIRNKTRKA